MHANVGGQLLAERTGAKLAFLPITGDIGLLDMNRLDAGAVVVKTAPVEPACDTSFRPWYYPGMKVAH